MEFYLSSDCASLARYVSKVVYLEDNDIAHIYDGELHIHCSKIGSEDFSFRTVQKLELELSKIKKALTIILCKTKYTSSVKQQKMS